MFAESFLIFLQFLFRFYPLLQVLYQFSQCFYQFHQGFLSVPSSFYFVISSKDFYKFLQNSFLQCFFIDSTKLFLSCSKFCDKLLHILYHVAQDFLSVSYSLLISSSKIFIKFHPSIFISSWKLCCQFLQGLWSVSWSFFLISSSTFFSSVPLNLLSVLRRIW